jgi:hypothetical protein
MDVRAARGVGGVMGTAWGATKVVGAARRVVEDGEAGDAGVMKGRVV